ncbi:MAG: hypothetical protein LBO05_14205 [Deltaproteobacteria bacterium]|jgi:hypothetical protein|nr:hypothetical protein [Deltaproteobacteria bacterium]
MSRHFFSRVPGVLFLAFLFLLAGARLAGSSLLADSSFEPFTESECRELVGQSPRYALAESYLYESFKALADLVDRKKLQHYLDDQTKWLAEGRNLRASQLYPGVPRIRALIMATEERGKFLEQLAGQEKIKMKPSFNGDPLDFSGEWRMTDAANNNVGSITVSDQNAGSFRFSYSGVAGHNFGQMHQKAVLVNPHTAVCLIRDQDDNPVEITFTRNKDSLVVRGGPKNGYFGMGVDMDGSYDRLKPAGLARDEFRGPDGTFIVEVD